MFSMSAQGGEPEEGHAAFVPFILAPGRTIDFDVKTLKIQIGTRFLQLERLSHRLGLTLGPYKTEAEGEEAIALLEGCLLWNALTRGFGIQYVTDRQPVHLSTVTAEPGSIPAKWGWSASDGNYDVNKATVIPLHKRLVRFEGGSATITIGTPGVLFLESLREALSFPNLSRIVQNSRLRLAIEIYANHHFEQSSDAKFISLVTALEALVPTAQISQGTQVVLERALQLVEVARDAHPASELGWFELDRLRGRLSSSGSQESIGFTLRSFVEEQVTKHPDLGQPSIAARQVTQAYNARSRFLHHGKRPAEGIGPHFVFLRDFVPRMLRKLFEAEVGAHHAQNPRQPM